jgi:hypothetical protein
VVVEEEADLVVAVGAGAAEVRALAATVVVVTVAGQGGLHRCRDQPLGHR